MSFQTMLAADALAVFANPAELGERITYYRDGRLHDGVDLMAVVERSEIVPSQFGDTDPLVREAIVHIPRGAAPLALDAVRKGVDCVDLVIVDGQPPMKALVTRILRSDPGMWEVEVTW